MTTPGLATIEAARQDGSWYTLDTIEDLIIPFSNSSKKNILFWIESAKRPQTRLNGIAETVSAAAQNRNPLAR